MNKEIFTKAMEVGYYFNMEINSHNDDRTENWTGTEDCATFAKAILDFIEEEGGDVSFAFYEIADETITGICDSMFVVKDHGYDDYCRGFLAGEILGYPYPETMELVAEAEKRWNANHGCGYYQEVLNDILKEKEDQLGR